MSHTMRCGDAVAVVDPADGGRLASLTLGGTEILGKGEPEEGMPPGWYDGSFPMAPYAGRVKDAAFSFGGASYRLPPNAGPHAGHGLVFDVPWTVEEVPTETQLAISCSLDHRWQFGGSAFQFFELETNRLSVRLELRNEEREMPGALGFHPWFRRDLGRGPLTLDFDPSVRLAPAQDGFPRVPSRDMGARPWDDVFVGLQAPPVIAWPGGPRLRIKSTSDVWIVYERQRDGVCVEPLTAPPDSLGSDRASIIRTGRPLALTMSLEWE